MERLLNFLIKFYQFWGWLPRPKDKPVERYIERRLRMTYEIHGGVGVVRVRTKRKYVNSSNITKTVRRDMLPSFSSLERLDKLVNDNPNCVKASVEHNDFWIDFLGTPPKDIIGEDDYGFA